MRQNHRLDMLGVIVIACLGVTMVSAQSQIKTTEVRHFEVISVKGNSVVAKTEEQGTQQYTVPDDFRFQVGGKQISVHELKPGMKGTATVTTTTTVTPVTVTEVKQGEVTKVFGNSIVVFTDGAYKLFTESDVQQKGVTILKNGQPTEFSRLKVGDKLTATIVTEAPPREVTEREVSAMLSEPPPPPPSSLATAPPGATSATPPPAGGSAATAAGAPPLTPPPAATEAPPAAPPGTTSPAPPPGPGSSTLVIGAIGVALLVLLIIVFAGRGKKPS